MPAQLLCSAFFAPRPFFLPLHSTPLHYIFTHFACLSLFLLSFLGFLILFQLPGTEVWRLSILSAPLFGFASGLLCQSDAPSFLSRSDPLLFWSRKSTEIPGNALCFLPNN